MAASEQTEDRDVDGRSAMAESESPSAEKANEDADSATLIVEETLKAEEISDDAPGDDGVVTEGAAAEESEDMEGVVASSEVPGVLPVGGETKAPPPTQPTPPAAPQSSGPGAFGLVFGGLVAGAIGFLVATFAVPEGWPNPRPSELDALETSLSDQTERLSTLSDEIETLRNATPAVQAGGETTDLAPLVERISGVETQANETQARLAESLANLEDRMAGLESRLAELEARPSEPGGLDGSAAMAAQLEEFRQKLDAVTEDAESRIAEAQDRASRIEADAAAAAAAAERAAALATIKAALDSGSDFSEALGVLPNAPEALTAVAVDGVPSLGNLQETFPDAARSALAEAQTVPESASAGERMVAFLKRRTNARSLSPREGDDADAILSRAEAALGSGDLASALAELEALPGPAKTEMSAWISDAQLRSAAVDALAALEKETN